MNVSRSLPGCAEVEPQLQASEPSAACGCISQMNEQLQPLGHALVTTLFGEPWVCIETYREKKGAKRAPKVLASYCPFCGTKYARPQ